MPNAHVSQLDRCHGDVLSAAIGARGCDEAWQLGSDEVMQLSFEVVIIK
jgi:hypothetical protein